MKIKVLHDFKDKEHDLKLRKKDEELTVSKERALFLTKMKLAEIMEEKGGDPKSPGEAQG